MGTCKDCKHWIDQRECGYFNSPSTQSEERTDAGVWLDAWTATDDVPVIITGLNFGCICFEEH